MIHRQRFELLIATNNPGKIREIRYAFRDLPLNLRFLEEFPHVLPVDEVGTTYQENAVLKALSYSNQTGVRALADDSGLEVDALGGRPGVLSARFGGECHSDQERTQKLLEALAHLPTQERTARFVCTMALMAAPANQRQFAAGQPRMLHIATGECKGLIAGEARGINGFGYDPVFLPAGYRETFAELSAKTKNVISHRAQALSGMRAFFEDWVSET
jgi:XTP/dITP diphosphohydrolase